ncbi:MAG TPA: DinB family protein [Vicinamibacterales bacterium]|nr:DinB family protein [Vicinamibacterales bacterium]
MRAARVACLVVAGAAAAAGAAIAEPAQQRGRGPAAPACATLACDVQGDWERTRNLLLGLVNAMPDDKWSFKPTPAQQTFAERVMHVATIDLALLGTLGGKTPVPAITSPKATTKAEVVAALQTSFDYGAAVIKEFNDQQLAERIASMPFLGPSVSRLKVIYFSMQHTNDIYGQLVVYLRLNGVTPPASNRGA